MNATPSYNIVSDIMNATENTPFAVSSLSPDEVSSLFPDDVSVTPTADTYDSEGAAGYITAVVLFYGFSIIFMLGLSVRRTYHLQGLHDHEKTYVSRVVAELPEIRRKHERLRIAILKARAVARLNAKLHQMETHRAFENGSKTENIEILTETSARRKSKLKVVVSIESENKRDQSDSGAEFNGDWSEQQPPDYLLIAKQNSGSLPTYEQVNHGYETDDEGLLGSDDGQLGSDDGQLESDDAQLESDDGQLESDDGQLESDDGQLESDDGQLESDDGQLESDDYQLESDDGQLESDEGHLEFDEGHLEFDEGHLESDEGHLESDEGPFGSSDLDTVVVEIHCENSDDRPILDDMV